MEKVILPDRVAIFSDIHWGKGRDSTVKLDIANKFVDWFITDIKAKGIDTVLFLGDWFDNRHSVNVNTINHSYLALKKICSVAYVHMIIGNHDCHFKNSNKVHSLAPFDEIKNLTVYDDPQEVMFASGKTALFCPWQWESKQHADKRFDYLFGHFEMNGIMLCGGVTSGCHFEMADMVKMSPKIFSGHYHLAREYKLNTNDIITVGCPFELDWGDIGNTKGYYTLDTKYDTHCHIKNDLSPKHFKIYLSKIKDGSQKLSKKLIEGNYIRVVVDQEYNYSDLTKLTSVLSKGNPLQIDPPDFVFSFSKNCFNGIDQTDSGDFHLSKADYIMKFIDKMEIDEAQKIDKEKLKEMIKSYYNSCEVSLNGSSED